MLEPDEIKRYERELRAMILRAGDEDPEGFAVIDQLLREATRSMRQAGVLTRRRGYSWHDLARALGCTRQAAYKRLHSTFEGAESDEQIHEAIRRSITYREND
jgi:hypothetical protein